MPTLDDLRAALDAKADEAPAPHDVLARVLDGAGRRRWSAPLVAAAAVVIIAGGVVVPVAMVGADRRQSEVAAVSSEPAPPTTSTTDIRPAPPPTPAGPQPTSFSYDFSFRATSRISFEYGGILPGRQVATVNFGVGAKDVATATVYDRGVFPARLVAGGRPVTVAGHRGYVARFSDPLQSLDPTVHLSVAWQYADDSWAVVYANDPSTKSSTQLVAAAQQLRPGQTAQLRIPFKVGYLPAGAVRESVDASGDGGEVGFTDGGAPDPRMIPFPGYGSGFEVDVSTIDECGPPCTVDRTGHVHVNHQGGYDLYVGRPVVVNGHRAFYDRGTGTVLVIAPTWYASVGFSGGGRNRFTEAELVGVARSITVAPSLFDQSTWYDAASAIPERG